MKAGDTDIIVVYCEAVSGLAATYATKSAFTAAGWNLTWKKIDGTAISPQPTWTMPVSGSGKRHQFNFIVPDGAFTVEVTVPPGYYATPCELSGEGDVYDVDAIGSAIATSNGVSVGETLLSSSSEMFDGDSIDLSMAVSEAALTSIGATSLADVTSREAYIKLNDVASGSPATVATLTETITSDTVGNRVVRVTLDTFPVALSLGANEKTRQCTAHLRLTKTTKTIIASEINLTVKWKATS